MENMIYYISVAKKLNAFEIITVTLNILTQPRIANVSDS